MLGNLHVRFGVGAGVKFHGLHHDVIVKRWSEFTGKTPQRIAVNPEPINEKTTNAD